MERDRDWLKHDNRALTPEEFSSSDSNSQGYMFPDKMITRYHDSSPNLPGGECVVVEGPVCGPTPSLCNNQLSRDLQHSNTTA